MKKPAKVLKIAGMNRGRYQNTRSKGVRNIAIAKAAIDPITLKMEKIQ